MADQKRAGIALSVFSSTGIGLLVGFFMGVSVSPTVGVVVGAIASSLALILGISDESFSVNKAVRIGTFGFTCVIAAVGGTYVRTHQLLAPDLQAQLQQYVDLGYEKEDALAIVGRTRLGGATVPSGSGSAKEGDNAGPSASLMQLAMTGALYSAEIDAGACSALRDADADGIALQTDFLGGVWQQIAESLAARLDEPADIGSGLVAVRDGVCNGDTAQLSPAEDCVTLAGHDLLSGDPVSPASLQTAGGNWNRLAGALGELDASLQPVVTSVTVHELCAPQSPG